MQLTKIYIYFYIKHEMYINDSHSFIEFYKNFLYIFNFLKIPYVINFYIKKKIRDLMNTLPLGKVLKVQTLEYLIV